MVSPLGLNNYNQMGMMSPFNGPGVMNLPAMLAASNDPFYGAFGGSGTMPGTPSIVRENPLPTTSMYGQPLNFSLWEPDGDRRMQNLLGGFNGVFSGAGSLGLGGFNSPGSGFNLGGLLGINPLFGSLNGSGTMPGTPSIVRENPLPTTSMYGQSLNFSLWEPDGDRRLQQLFAATHNIFGP